MKITLIRHGQSIWTMNKAITCSEFRYWAEKYDENGVNREKCYPPATITSVYEASVIFTSDLKRSIDSAQYLEPKVKVISNQIFRETELPVSPFNVGRIKLRPTLWTILLRCAWFLNYANGCESLKDAKVRARKAADLLIAHVKDDESIVLVGHGFFNLFIAKELRKRGWSGDRRTSSLHWHATTYLFN